MPVKSLWLVHPVSILPPTIPTPLEKPFSFPPSLKPNFPNILCMCGQWHSEEEMIKHPHVWNSAKCVDYHLFNSFLSWTERGLMARTYCSPFLDINKEHPADFLRWLRVTCWIDLFVPSFPGFFQLDWSDGEYGIVRIIHKCMCARTHKLWAQHFLLHSTRGVFSL